MALLDILKFPDPLLRKKSVPVDAVTEEMAKFAQDMLETMYSFSGIGLAAPQVNRRIRLFTADCRPTDDKGARYHLEDSTDLEKTIDQPIIIFNPVITKKEGKTTYDEGCLSLPSYYETVTRYEYIEVEGLNINGEKIEFKVDGLLSICMQHEIDHLDGKLFIDRLSTIKSSRIKSKIKKFGYPDDEENDDESEEWVCLRLCS